jgi:hypothetical protein
MSRRLTIDLDDDDGAELDRLAEGQRTDAEGFARGLLIELLRNQGHDSRTATEVLDGIPGAWERAQEGRAQINAGRGVSLQDL